MSENKRLAVEGVADWRALDDWPQVHRFFFLLRVVRSRVHCCTTNPCSANSSPAWHIELNRKGPRQHRGLRFALSTSEPTAVGGMERNERLIWKCARGTL